MCPRTLQEAAAECRRETSDGGRLPYLGEAYHALGRLKETDSSLQQATEVRGFDQAYLIASAFAFGGQPDRAFELLHRAYNQRDPILQYIKTAPGFEHPRDDQRYKILRHQMNLPE
jgi:hypothetical protein